MKTTSTTDAYRSNPGTKELVRAGELSVGMAYVALLGRGYADGGEFGLEYARNCGAARWLRDRAKKQKVKLVDPFS